ncbi:DUF4440 domain-containing protein [Streptomyces diastatochromogenes]|uniref:DUF4440 domain-containing protein n=1 Tax=Streptomyces diastatochromogenes TaxID=42236 RepID=A0A233S5R4_STRDA|nr:DUF4440 domain-containing protein [Streptomyces diastatochromogenes]MCZ0985133.1 DUF4440 domain-containing protein [Streptomyces diastatochromogenes]OXY91006.1 DUF4440 domain-containing protein [Streptomyces diastatochromogenes]
MASTSESASESASESEQVSAAIAGELALMDPRVRSSRDLARQWLDPEYVEVGASGRRWTLRDILAALPDMAGSADEGPHYEPVEMTGVLLAPGLVHLTYETVLDGRHARRSSLWRRRDAQSGWRMYYHQATPVPPVAE